MPKQIVVYIHGVQNDVRGSSHQPTYRKLHEGIKRYKPTGWPTDFCGIEWGWNDQGRAHPDGHELLTDAQEQLGGRTLRVVRDAPDFTLDPTRIVVNQFRPLMMYGFSDMFYYVSADGKNSVRYAVAEQIVERLHDDIARQRDISLTLIGHSAGSVIAFDFLFYLFYARSRPTEHERGAREDDHVFIETEKVDRVKSRTITDLRRLRALAQKGKLRVRRLFTLGSPLAMLAYRSNALLKILADSTGRIDPKMHGLTQQPFGTLRGPRWVNIWDKDDPIAWPVEPMMGGAGTVVVDEYIDVSDNPRKAHGEYWTSAAVHRAVARVW